jgi:hypothetical protein
VNTTERKSHVCNAYCAGTVHASVAFGRLPRRVQAASNTEEIFGPTARFIGGREAPEVPIPDWATRTNHIFPYLLFIEVPS